MRGTWFRSSRYRLWYGRVAPEPDAELLRFDPWRTYRKNLGKYRTVEQPYLSLLELKRSLDEEAEASGSRPTQPQKRVMEGPVVGPPTLADGRILDWCNHHGHLGIFPVMSTLVQLDDSRESDEFGVTRTQYVRDGDEWHVETASQFEWLSSAEATEDHVRSRLVDSHGKHNWFNFNSRTHDEQPIDELRHYFPHLERRGNRFAPPLPLTDEFWRSYGEPVWEIGRFCDLFARAVDYLKEWNDDATPDEQHSNVRRASLFLKDLARNVEVDDLEHIRRSAGLLASYALMFLWDRADGRRCLQCARCDSHFVSNDRRGLYCSPRCRNIVQIRRHREKRAASKGINRNAMTASAQFNNH